MNMQKMLQEAQKLQKDLEKTKESLEKIEYEAESSFVKAKVNGKKELISLKIDEEISLDDLEMLEDIIVIAVNKALEKAEKDKEEKMGKYGQGISGLF